MENEGKKPKSSVHRVLAHSYVAQFLFFLAGIYLNIFYNIKIFNNSIIVLIGFLFLITGTFLIVWAQKTSKNLKKENISKETFVQGPYKYTRSPTHWGIFMLMLGFGMIISAFFVILFSFISFIFTKLTFLNKEEKILAEKYGEPYIEYKKSVKF